jgi:hypothetical protein
MTLIAKIRVVPGSVVSVMTKNCVPDPIGRIGYSKGIPICKVMPSNVTAHVELVVLTVPGVPQPEGMKA